MVNVKGLGYIGLPTALMLAAHGVEVVGIDRSAKLVDSLDRGELTFEEKGLEELFHKALDAGIRFQTEDLPADIYIIKALVVCIKSQSPKSVFAFLNYKIL